MVETVLLVKETRPGEKRVALVPADVKLLVDNGLKVFVEEAAGVEAGFSDAQYQKVGAETVNVAEKFADGFPVECLLLRVKRGSEKREQWELARFTAANYMMGFLDPLQEKCAHVEKWQQAGLTTFTMDQLNLSVDDPNNLLSAMSRIAGRLALDNTLANYSLEQKANVVILGTGVAAIAAAKQALKQGYIPQVIGRNEKHRVPIESLGAEYHALPATSTDEVQADFIRHFLQPNPCVVVTAARSKNAVSPVLINKKSLGVMHSGSVIADLSGEGINVEGALSDQTVITENNIKIIRVSAYPKQEPKEASEVYSNGLVKLVLQFLILGMDIQQPLLQSCYVTHLGEKNPILFAGL